MSKKIVIRIFVFLLVLANVAAIVYSVNKLRRSHKLIKSSVQESHDVARTSIRVQDELTKIMLEVGASENTKRKIFNLMVEESQTNPQVGDGYQGLAFIEGKDKSNNGLFNAVENTSYALEARYSKESVEYLAGLLGLEDNLEDIGYSSKEIPLLLQKIKENNEEGSFLAALRLSLIYKLGRASSYEEKGIPQIIKALPLRKKALEAVQVQDNKVIDVVITIDDNYASHAASAVASMLMNAKPETFYRFYFIMDPDNPILPNTQEKLRELKQIKDCEFIFQNFPQRLLPDSVLKWYEGRFKRWPKSILYRLFLDKIFPDKDRILYLDADVTVMQDLQPLFYKNIDNYLVAAASDSHSIARKSSCRKRILKVYINSGMLLINLKEWKKRDAYNKILKEVFDPRCKISFPDQDINNRMSQFYIYELSPVWNHPNSGTRTLPFIKHMYDIYLDKKKLGDKAWGQKDSEEKWCNKPDEMLDIFQHYWAYRDITPWKVKCE